MTPLRLGINGANRVGISVATLGVLRARDLDHPSITRRDRPLEVVAIRDERSADELAGRLAYDSTRRFPRWDVRSEDGHVRVDGHAIRVYSAPADQVVPWQESGVDIVLDCTGRSVERSRRQLDDSPDAGPQKVIVGALGSVDATVVLGVNDDAAKRGDARVVSTADPLTQAIAPVLAAMDRAFGVRWALLASTGSLATNQPVLDGTRLDQHGLDRTAVDLSSDRAGPLNVVPAATHCARATALVWPQLAGRLDDVAVRVPVAAGSRFEITCTLADTVELDRVLDMLDDAAAADPLRGIVSVSRRALVSSDVVADTHSAIVDASACRRIGPLLRIAGWFDEEVAYAARMLDLAAMLGPTTEAA